MPPETDSASPLPVPFPAKRILPHSIEAEMGLLCSLMIGGRDTAVDLMASGYDECPESWFFKKGHHQISEAIRDGIRKQDIPTQESVCEYLRERKTLEEIGGERYVSEIATLTPTAANAAWYAEILAGYARQRQVIALCGELTDRAYQELSDDESGQLITDAAARFTELVAGELTASFGQPEPMKDQVLEAIEAVEKLYEHRNSVTGQTSGIVKLDKLLNGLLPGQVILVAGRPSMGKSSFVRKVVQHVAITEKKAVAIYSLQCVAQQYVQALMCSRAHVSLNRLRDGFLTERDFPNLTKAAAELAESRIYLDDTAPITIGELRAKARRMKAVHDISLIVVDRLHLIGADVRPKDGNRTKVVSEVAIGLKLMARELKIPVLVIASLNRGPESRDGGKPRLSDLRDSGDLEANADVVLFLVREDFYAEEDEAEELAGKVKLIVAKQPAGPLDSVDLRFDKDFLSFAEEGLPEAATAPATPPPRRGGKRQK